VFCVNQHSSETKDKQQLDTLTDYVGRVYITSGSNSEAARYLRVDFRVQIV